MASSGEATCLNFFESDFHRAGGRAGVWVGPGSADVSFPGGVLGKSDHDLRAAPPDFVRALLGYTASLEGDTGPCGHPDVGHLAPLLIFLCIVARVGEALVWTVLRYSGMLTFSLPVRGVMACGAANPDINYKITNTTDVRKKNMEWEARHPDFLACSRGLSRPRDM